MPTLEQEKTLLPIPAKTMSITDIMNIIPHRHPFLFVDRVTDHEPGQYMLGYKQLSMSESFFQGHFPGNPIMPGVLQIEALAQLSAILVSCMPEGQGKLGLFAGINNARFRKMVSPGDRLDLRVELLKLRGPIGKIQGTGTV